jgi:Fe-S cluster assembly protein SufD
MSNTIHTPVADYLVQFSEAEKSFSPKQAEMKKAAIRRFEELGFPTTKNEDWKYTNIAGLFTNSFKPAEKEFRLTLNDIQQFLPAEKNLVVLVFENGVFNPALSQLDKLPAGIVAGDLQKFSDHAAVISHLGRIAPVKNEGFVALNTAMFRQGAFVYADKNVQCETGIHILFINDARSRATVSYQRNLYVAATGSSLKISENYYSIHAVNPSFCNPVTEMHVGENAHMELTKNESENSNDFHIDYTGIIQEANSSMHIHTITSGGRIVRNNLKIELKGKNASAYLNGLYVVSGESHVDNHSVVDHASPDCYSNELYKGVLDGKSRGVFNGRIYVARDAQKTNAYQSNKNILLSDDASMNAKPQLEIYADDVKCSHGATTGQIDPEALFYLRSRGIGEREASALLTNAFAEEILDKIALSSAREKLKEIIHSNLKKGIE